MHEVRRGAPRPAHNGAAVHTPYDRGEQSLEEQVQSALNLFLTLKNPAQMPALLAILDQVKPKVQAALGGLHYVHFARFLPTRDGSTLLVITEYDGDLDAYLMDFVAVLGDEFNAILEFVQDAPRLPVQQYPRDFCDFVTRNNLAQVKAWSAYPEKTVIDIQGPRRTLPPAVREPAPANLDLADIQGNILRGYRVSFARHFALALGDSAAARRFINGLIGGDESISPQITTAAHWQERPAYFLNIGLTWSGLQALGLPTAVLQGFPQAFREGPAAEPRASQLGDTEASAPENWVIGNPQQTTHLLLSLYADSHQQTAFEQQTQRLRQLFTTHGIVELSCFEAQALPNDQVHFGYRDSIAQPRIAGAPGREKPDMQPAASAGEFLLGKDYINQYAGNFIGDLPGELCNNATYAALRMLKQDVHAFEDLITQAGQRHNLDPELVAAKLMGRWRDGSPLILAPEAPCPHMPSERLNNFDYAPTAEHSTYYDDADGLRCPVGAHIRRLNPRGALVTGKPYSRRIIRRGMPYGPAFNPQQPDDGIERGLLGLFICGDLAMQYEFLMRTWVNQDIQTRGLQNSRDPILGAQPPEGGHFVIRTGDSRDPIELTVPRLITTRGSLYLLIPGIAGLRYLGAL